MSEPTQDTPTCEWCDYLRQIGATEEYIAMEHKHAADHTGLCLSPKEGKNE